MQYLQNDSSLQGGKYKIVRFLSSGGFGNTYEGVHTMMDTRVAIKEFFPKMFCNRDENTSHITVATQGNRELVDKLRKKFNEEAKAVFQMNHPNIVRVLDIFEENGTAYYVMEFVDGKSLNEISKERGALSEAEAVGYTRQVADALKYVHSLNRLHLDIKPGNIMVDKNGKAILIDFGASKHYDDESGENTSTLMGVNTKGYAPIEQSTQSFTSFSPATDIYALGATLYKLLTGIVPPDANLLLAEEEALQPLPNSISDSTRNAVLTAMQLRRKDRPQSVAEFLMLLGELRNSSINNVMEGKRIIDEDEETVIDTYENNNLDNLLSLAEQGNALAQRSLGDAYTTSINANYDLKKAIYWYTKAAEQGDGIAQYELAVSYGENFEDDIKSEYWFKKATISLNGLRKAGCTDGRIYYSLAECLDAGYEIEEEDIDAESLFEESIPHLEDTAHKGNSISQNFLGEYYYFQEGNYEKAFYWYNKAATQGHISAQCQLGEFHKDGVGVEKNIEHAINWFTKAAEKGHGQSQFNLGLLYYYDCNEKKRQEGINWLTKAAEQGNSTARNVLNGIQKGHDCVKEAEPKLNDNEDHSYSIIIKVLAFAGLVFFGWLAANYIHPYAGMAVAIIGILWGGYKGLWK